MLFAVVRVSSRRRAVEFTITLKEHSNIYLRVLFPYVLVLSSVYSIPVSFRFNVKLGTIIPCNHKVRGVGMLNDVFEFISFVFNLILKFCLESLETSENFWFPRAL